METVSPEESALTLRAFDKQIAEPLAVSDIKGFRSHSIALVSRISELRAERKAEREQTKAGAHAQRETLVGCAEAIAASVNVPINWRGMRAELIELFECRKDA